MKNALHCCIETSEYATGHDTFVIWDVDEAGMGKIYNEFCHV